MKKTEVQVQTIVDEVYEKAIHKLVEGGAFSKVKIERIKSAAKQHELYDSAVILSIIEEDEVDDENSQT